MFELDGIVYASEPDESMHVKKCKSLGDGIMLITFSTGETRLLDAFELTTMPAFAPLRDQETLDDFVIEDGILTWLDGKIDISAEALYTRSYEYQQIA